MLSETQEKFLAKRKKLTKLWVWVGTVMLLFVVIYWGYLFFQPTLLVNPYLCHGSVGSWTII